MSYTPEQIVALVQEAGVVGAAGTGYPTYAKLQARARTVVINGAECEPLVCTDRAVLCAHADDVVQGLKLAMIAVGATEGVIAINRSAQDAITSIRAAIEAMRASNTGGNITVHLMGDYYPAGDELNVVYDVCGIVVPEGATPLEVGVLIINVTTARQIYQAVNGIAPTERAVTVAGAVQSPLVVTVPIGTRYIDLINLAGGYARVTNNYPSAPEKTSRFSVIEGGPMMGKIIDDLAAGISKSTSAITIFPSDHYVIQMKTKPLAEITKQSRSINSERSETTDLCPRHLLGHSLQPHEAMTALDYSRAEPSEAVTRAFLCSGCGVCELLGDEAAFSSPKKIYDVFKARLLKAGIKNPHRREGFSVHSQYENRKLSTQTLIKKLGIGDYVAKPAFLRASSARAIDKPTISLVRVPTSRHVGEPAHPQVQLNQHVRRGDLIAASSEDFLGTRYHAPIHGRVTDITETHIEITGDVV